MRKREKNCKVADLIDSLPEVEITRRALLKTGALLGGSALLMSRVEKAYGLLRSAEAAAPGEYPLSSAKNVIYSVCLQCHNACPIKVKVLDGVAVKMDGNPYSAQNMIPNLEQKSSPWTAAKIDAIACPKGQAGVQSLYDPYRIVKVLKRNGPRGSNKWKVIPFSEAIDEIVNGGTLFKSIGESRHVPGLKEIYKLRDPKIAKNMAADSKAVARKKMSVGDFKAKFRDHLDLLIDSNHPDLGPLNNQFVLQYGRIEHGRK
ncbi:MAG: molybdopterin oxidoreductase, partial [bacterium]